MVCNIESYLFQIVSIWMYCKQTTRSNYIDLISGVSSNCKFGAGYSCLQSESLKMNLYTLSGIMLASGQVSILALKHFIFFKGFRMYAKFVTRCCGASNLVSACSFICKQKDSSLDELLLEWPHIEPSCVDNLPLVNCYALGNLGLFL